MGQVITFYSYKGGVGRTMALANVSVTLAQWGYKVLVIDWDLEAPGIEHYFSGYIDLEAVRSHKGIIDLLDRISSGQEGSAEQVDWRALLTTIQLPESEHPLNLITAGQRTEQYFSRLRSLDVQTFYSEKGGGLFIESLRNQWKQHYDFVLIDSRTGITDIGGICTVQLPDMLILLFTATEQSLRGTIDINRKVQKARQKLPFDRMNIVSVPIPSRFDTQTEFAISQDWLSRFANELPEVYANWLPTSVNKREILEVTKIPYVSYFSFGEKLPVVEQGTVDPAGLGYAYETLASLIANNLESVDRLLENRSEYLMSASKKPLKSRPKPSVFISYSHKDEDWKNRLMVHLAILRRQGVFDVWNDSLIGVGHDWYEAIQNALDSAKVVVLLITADYLASNFIEDEEVPRLLEQQRKHGAVIIPIIVKPCLWQYLDWLRNIQVLPTDGEPLSSKTESQIDANLAAVTERIYEVLKR